VIGPPIFRNPSNHWLLPNTEQFAEAIAQDIGARLTEAVSACQHKLEHQFAISSGRFNQSFIEFRGNYGRHAVDKRSCADCKSNMSCCVRGEVV